MHPKCQATGKAVFPSEEEARYRMHVFRIPVHNKITGLRIKHRRGRPAQKRAYVCPFCKSYHLTSWSLDRLRQAFSANT